MFQAQQSDLFLVVLQDASNLTIKHEFIPNLQSGAVVLFPEHQVFLEVDVLVHDVLPPDAHVLFVLLRDALLRVVLGLAVALNIKCSNNLLR